MLAGLPLVFGDGRLVIADQRVRPGAVDFKLRVGGCPDAGAALVARVRRARPTLARHACSADELELPGHMTLPHLVEHVAIDLLVERGAARGGTPVAGYTVWLDRASGLARVTISSCDTASTERALVDAVRLCLGC